MWRTVIPSSLEPVQFGLDKTGSWGDLLQLLEANKTKTDYESTSIDKIHLAKQKAKELGIARLKQCKWLDTNMVLGGCGYVMVH